jgi:hypothetical protein
MLDTGFCLKSQYHHMIQEGGCKEIQVLLAKENFELMISERWEGRRAL